MLILEAVINPSLRSMGRWKTSISWLFVTWDFGSHKKCIFEMCTMWPLQAIPVAVVSHFNLEVSDSQTMAIYIYIYAVCKYLLAYCVKNPNFFFWIFNDAATNLMDLQLSGYILFGKVNCYHQNGSSSRSGCGKMKEICKPSWTCSDSDDLHCKTRSQQTSTIEDKWV